MPISPLELFVRGGAFMWPLLALSVLALTLIVERAIFFSLHRYRLGRSLDTLRSRAGDLDSRNPLVNVGTTMMREASGGLDHIQNIAGREAVSVVSSHERGLRVLGLIGMVSPLVGLLGTVWGMVIAFSKIAELGDQVTPADFAGGIWTALLTTVGGLIVAIPAVAATRIFEGKVDRLALDINSMASHVSEWLFGPQAGKPELAEPPVVKP